MINIQESNLTAGCSEYSRSAVSKHNAIIDGVEWAYKRTKIAWQPRLQFGQSKAKAQCHHRVGLAALRVTGVHILSTSPWAMSKTMLDDGILQFAQCSIQLMD
jgi:hypothetical protein